MIAPRPKAVNVPVRPDRKPRAGPVIAPRPKAVNVPVRPDRKPWPWPEFHAGNVPLPNMRRALQEAGVTPPAGAIGPISGRVRLIMAMTQAGYQVASAPPDFGQKPLSRADLGRLGVLLTRLEGQVADVAGPNDMHHIGEVRRLVAGMAGGAL